MVAQDLMTSPSVFAGLPAVAPSDSAALFQGDTANMAVGTTSTHRHQRVPVYGRVARRWR
jgi:hypothetical protein